MPYRRTRARRGRMHSYPRTFRKFTPTRRGPSTKYETGHGSWNVASTSDGHMFAQLVGGDTGEIQVIGGIKYTVRLQQSSSTSTNNPVKITYGLIKTDVSLPNEQANPTDRERRSMFAKETVVDFQGPNPLLVQRSVKGTVPLKRDERLWFVAIPWVVSSACNPEFIVEYSINTDKISG